METPAHSRLHRKTPSATAARAEDVIATLRGGRVTARCPASRPALAELELAQIKLVPFEFEQFKLEQAAGMPAAAMQPFTAQPAGQVAQSAAVGGADAAIGTAGDPARWPQAVGGQGIAVAHTHLEFGLGAVDRRHAGPEMGSVHLP